MRQRQQHVLVLSLRGEDFRGQRRHDDLGQRVDHRRRNRNTATEARRRHDIAAARVVRLVGQHQAGKSAQVLDFDELVIERIGVEVVSAEDKLGFAEQAEQAVGQPADAQLLRVLFIRAGFLQRVEQRRYGGEIEVDVALDRRRSCIPGNGRQIYGGNAQPPVQRILDVGLCGAGLDLRERRHVTGHELVERVGFHLWIELLHVFENRGCQLRDLKRIVVERLVRDAGAQGDAAAITELRQPQLDTAVGCVEIRFGAIQQGVVENPVDAVGRAGNAHRRRVRQRDGHAALGNALIQVVRADQPDRRLAVRLRFAGGQIEHAGNGVLAE